MKNANKDNKNKKKPENNPEKKPETTKIEEIGGRGGLDPTRFDDWEIAGRCVDF